MGWTEASYTHHHTLSRACLPSHALMCLSTLTCSHEPIYPQPSAPHTPIVVVLLAFFRNFKSFLQIPIMSSNSILWLCPISLLDFFYKFVDLIPPTFEQTQMKTWIPVEIFVEYISRNNIFLFCSFIVWFPTKIANEKVH